MSKPIVLKIILAGDGGVGKTTLLYKYVRGTFLADTKMTIGVEFFLKEIEIDDNLCILQLWDFSGQDRFRFLLQSYVLGARGALLMFDLTRTMTLDNFEQWVNICRREDPSLPILMLGTKADLLDDMCIDEKYITMYKEKYDLCNYLKISSKTGENVSLSFEILTKEILNRIF